MHTQLDIDYWSDPLCVWAFVAQPRLEAVLAHHGPRVRLRHRMVPVFGSVPGRFRPGGSWAEGGPAGKAALTRRVAAAHGHPEVTGAVWVDDPPASSWAPGAAVKAVQALEAAGTVGPGAAADYLWRVRHAFFVRNRNVARRSVLLEVAMAAGLPVGGLEAGLDDGTALAALFEDHEAKDNAGVPGSPTWVFDGGRARLYGNFDERVLHCTVDTLVAGLAAGGSAC